ncbi:A/G-specific adenine glycosylase [Arenibacter sp. GZD-96]|uniref:A/G-specific adenine glycosylase n=1 Tax=Aurantibrevibacter litoralis TaxID=3106030 RepID=UPI003A4D83FC
MTFSEKILHWYALNKRALPWRSSQNPYHIWLSEIILQQTRVAQGIPYYQKFVTRFPTVVHLAEAQEEEVLKLWQGLGYYSRARNLHAAAKTVVTQYNGSFPETYQELIRLKGIGDYTASAIASICFAAPEPVVDGNVYRVLARYFGIATPINSSEGISYFKTLARKVMDTKNVRDYNQGIMEFGALQCQPKNPNCAVCPLANECNALEKKTIGHLPVKLNRNNIRKRFFNYIVPLAYDKEGKPRTKLKQRKGKGIWENLYEFPLLETENSVNEKFIWKEIDTVVSHATVQDIYVYNTTPILHKLSHQHLVVHFWIVSLKEDFPESLLFSEIERYPVPVLIAEFINTFKI